jgi:formylglycine-generating enzyme required for sulfatase activity
MDSKQRQILISQELPEMITVTGGTFKMGNEYSSGETAENPVHSVTLSTFNIGKTPITVEQYVTFCNATKRRMPEKPEWEWSANHPIANVTFHDALYYCDWLSHITKNLYRLPTEAEWEYAARGGNKSKGSMFSGSSDLDEVGWFIGNAEGQPHNVTTKMPNELGLYDMSGNVWEWCSDKYDPTYYERSPVFNPKGGIGTKRVVRGGSWYVAANLCGVSSRSFCAPGHSYFNLGFRVASNMTGI